MIIIETFKPANKKVFAQPAADTCNCTYHQSEVSDKSVQQKQQLYADWQTLL